MAGEFYITTCPTWKTWTTASTATCATDVWTPWCATGTTTTSSTSTTWGTWCNGEITYRTVQSYAPRIITQSPEEIARRQADLKKADEIRVKAEARANQLLRELLTPDQRVQYDDKRRFYVITDSGKRYEVDCQKKMHNVFEVDAVGKRIEEHCIYANGNVPLPDNAAAQLLLLRANEPEFRRIANQRRLA